MAIFPIGLDRAEHPAGGRVDDDARSQRQQEGAERPVGAGHRLESAPDPAAGGFAEQQHLHRPRCRAERGSQAERGGRMGEIGHAQSRERALWWRVSPLP